MGADSTLEGAAFKYGASKAKADVPDLTPLSKGQVDISKSYTDVLASIKAKEKALKAARDNQLRAFKKTAAEAEAHILKDEHAQPMKVHNAIYDEFKALEEEFMLYNTSGKNDTEENEKMRAYLYARLQMITNQAVKSRGTIAEKAVLANQLIASAMDADEIEVAKAIMSVNGNYENIELSFNEKGQLTYLVSLKNNKIYKWTIDDFNKNVHIHDKNIDVYGRSAATNAYKLGNTTNEKWEIDKHKGDFKDNVIQNEEGKFTNAAFHTIDGRKSWRDSLLDGDNIDLATTAIEHLFKEDMVGRINLTDVTGDGVVTDIDLKKMVGSDGKITAADLMNLSSDEKEAWQSNIEEMVNALTKTRHSAFDFDLSSDLLADYFVGGLGEKFTNGRNNKYNDPSNTTINLMDISKRIDKITEQENPSLLEMNSLIGGGGERKQIKREGNDYVIVEREGKGGDSELERFSVNDKKALSTYLHIYSKGNKRYSKTNYSEYEYGEGDTIENPILRNKKTGGPPKKDGKEGKYYKNAHSGQVYLFTGGEWKEIGSEGEKDNRPKVEIK